MLISEFNTIISNEIKNQPIPLIYERIGEKFNHYFIDEFQDTSVLQWGNLIPLIDNSLSAENGSALLVGDAKQAIYRWRGGKAEQFIDLFNEKVNPFQVEAKIDNLPTNYRSLKEIVTFNNGFFKFLSNGVFENKDYETLYQNAHQTIDKNENGYVELTLLDFDRDDDKDEVYPSKVLETITRCIKNGFSLEDICVLVRKQKEGVAVANYLSQNNIPIISSETLLVYNAPEVQFIVHVLTLLIRPKNDELKVTVLNYLASAFNVTDKHAFFVKHLDLSMPQLFKSFEQFEVFVDSQTLLQLSLYDLTETLIRAFNLVETSNAYVQFFLDVVLDYTHKKGSDISGFLEYFSKKKNSLSIVSPQGQNAVQIMTIHKSKGLEFPIVIFPYAELDIYFEIDPKEWFPVEPENYNGFSNALLNYSKDFEHFDKTGFDIYNNHKAKQELDNINVLYVALTRAIEQLYVISKKEVSSKGVVNDKKYSGMFINYLIHLGLWNDSTLTYSFGSPEKPNKKEDRDILILEEQDFISTAKEDHNIKIVANSGYLWDTHQEEAIEKGNLIHAMMSKIKTKDDVDYVVNDFLEASMIDSNQMDSLKKTILEIVEHPKLKDCFIPDNMIHNERDIITKKGQILRPDRIVINSKKETYIIDYKTGREDKSHFQQLISYQDVLESMHLNVTKKFLVYINNTIEVKEL